MSLLDAALELATQGFYVFPLQVNGKLPAIKDFDFNTMATRDPAQIKRWWIDPVLEILQPLNIGISTTKFDGGQALIVVDVDNKGAKRGDDEILKLELKGKEFASTATQVTPTGGYHLIYRNPNPVKQGASVLAPGLDIRSKGGYIVGAGSMIDGKPYAWKQNSAEIEPCPQWIIEVCGRVPDRVPRESEKSNINPDSASRRADYYLKNEAPLAIAGSAGDQTTFKVAAHLKDFGVSEETALSLMLDQWNERCEPPWSANELKRKVGNAFQYGKDTPGSKAPESEFTAIEKESTDAPRSAEVRSKEKRFQLEHFREIRLRGDSDYLVKGLLDKCSIAALVGPSNVGKSFVALDLAMSVAMGKNWNKRKVKQGAVVYIAAEAPGSLRKRTVAYRTAYNIDLAADLPFCLLCQPIDFRSSDADVTAIIKAIKDFESAKGVSTELLVLDTLAAAVPGADENSFKDMSALMGRLQRIRSAIDSTILVVHHMGKNEEKGARGHSSLRAAFDTEIHVRNGALTVDKQRDQEKKERIPFRLRSIDLGQDAEGDVITSCVVEFDSPANDFQAPPEMLVPGSQAAQAYETLIAAGGTKGKQIHVTAEWRKALFSGPFSKMKPSARSQAFKRAREELLNLGLIEASGSLVTATSQVHMTSHVNLSESPSSSHVHNPIGV